MFSGNSPPRPPGLIPDPDLSEAAGRVWLPGAMEGTDSSPPLEEGRGVDARLEVRVVAGRLGLLFGFGLLAFNFLVMPRLVHRHAEVLVPG